MPKLWQTVQTLITAPELATQVYKLKNLGKNGITYYVIARAYTSLHCLKPMFSSTEFDVESGILKYWSLGSDKN